MLVNHRPNWNWLIRCLPRPERGDEHMGQRNFAKIPLLSIQVIFVPPVTSETFCEPNLEGWPWSEQNCTLKLGSWTYAQKDIELGPMVASWVESPVEFKNFRNKRVRYLRGREI